MYINLISYIYICLNPMECGYPMYLIHMEHIKILQ